MPEPARKVFLTLCCTEENDRRTSFNLDAGDELALLTECGLIEIVDHHLSLHPGVAEAGRAMADPEFARSVGEKFANMWVASLAFGRGRESTDGNTALIVDAAVGAAPYLHRLERWEQLAWVCEAALCREKTPRMVASLLPFLETVATKDNGLPMQSLYASTVALIDRPRGHAMLRGLFTRAVSERSYAAASSVATDLAHIYQAEGRLTEALALAREASEYTRLAGFGQFTQIGSEYVELSILLDLGCEREVLEGVRRLLSVIPDSSDAPE